jgi:hypothetical protein
MTHIRSSKRILKWKFTTGERSFVAEKAIGPAETSSLSRDVTAKIERQRERRGEGEGEGEGGGGGGGGGCARSKPRVMIGAAKVSGQNPELLTWLGLSQPQLRFFYYYFFFKEKI